MEESVTKRVAKNFAWLSVGDIISRGLNFFAYIYIARVLGAAGFGLISFAIAFQAYLVLFVDSGLSLLGTRKIAREKEKAGAISLNIFVIRFLIALLVFLLSCFVLYLVPLSFEMRMLFMAAFLFVFYRALNTDWAFQGLEKMEYIAFARILYSLFAFSAIILLVKTGGNLIKVPLIQFASGFLVSILFVIILFKHFAPAALEHLVPRNWWDYFSEALPLGASVILIQIYYNMDTIMLGFMDKPEVVGYYNAAYKIFLVFIGFLGLWQSTAFPVVSRRMGEEREKAVNFLNKYARLTLMVVIPVALLITYLAPFIINLFYGVEYILAFPALQILIWSMVLIVISGIYGILVMIPLGMSREFLYGVGSGALANIILNLILIPPFSFKGAAVATLLSEAAVTAAMFYLIRKEVNVKIIENLKIPILASAIATLFYWLFMQWGTLYFKLIGGSIVFMVVYLVVVLVFGEKQFLFDFYSEIARRG